MPGVPVMIIDADGQEASLNTEGDIAVEVQQAQSKFYGLFKGYIDMSTGAIDQKIKTFPNGGKFYLTGDRATKERRRIFLVRRPRRRCYQLEWLPDRCVNLDSLLHEPANRRLLSKAL